MRNFPQGIILSAAIAISGCLGSGGGEGDGRQHRDSRNEAPTIQGTPELNVLEGDLYEFQPRARDAEGDALAFSISHLPAWAEFDAASGRLWGTPGPGDVGIFRDVGIKVSDGRRSAELRAFDISVNQAWPGSATLSWNPPTENADGSLLGDLAGYRIYYGKMPSRLNRVVTIDNPGLTRFVVENLSPARWFFAMTSVNSGGVESRRSKVVSKRVS